jgi:hypothetical protein
VPALNRLAFIKNYANLVARTWVDDAYRQLLLSDPVTALANAGLPTVAGAEVIVLEHKIPGVAGSIDGQVEEWLTGNQTGRYVLYLPMKPDNANVTQGGAGGDVIGCCTTPCSCCGNP